MAIRRAGIIEGKLGRPEPDVRFVSTDRPTRHASTSVQTLGGAGSIAGQVAVSRIGRSTIVPHDGNHPYGAGAADE